LDPRYYFIAENYVFQEHGLKQTLPVKKLKENLRD
jgi:hypothetical protein